MKKLLSITYILLITLVGCSGVIKDDNKENYYSTEVDTSYNYADRTKIESVTRKIYSKFITSSLSGDLIRSVRLSNSFYKKENSFMIWESGKDILDAASLQFINEDELLDFFSKVDSLDLGKELNERKKTKHYVISKEEDKILIKQWSNGKMGKEVELSTEEYSGIKDSYNKFSK